MLGLSRNESGRQWSRVGRIVRVVQSWMVRKAEKKGGERYGGMDDVEAQTGWISDELWRREVVNRCNMARDGWQGWEMVICSLSNTP
jgi:hypothetical protein